MGPVQPAVGPGYARFSAVLMGCLSLLALVAAAIQIDAGGLATAGLFLVLAALGAWQMVYYHRLR